MRFRTRLLVCGYEPEQSLGEDHYEEERWWVHAATFSAQGPYSLPWWPVPEDTVKGDLFILRLAAFEVPPAVRAELSDGQIEIGKGAAGALAAEAISYSGFPLFGASPDESRINLPDHPEFDPSRKILGDGLVGLAVAHSAASPLSWVEGLHEALVGTFVPFPDVIGTREVARHLGPPFDDLETPMKQRTPDQIEVDAGQYERLIDLVLDRFPDDGDLGDAVLRLKEVAARLGQPVSYYAPRLGPPPRYPGRVDREDTSDDEFVSNGFWGPDRQSAVSAPPPRPSKAEASPEPETGGGPVGQTAWELIEGILQELLGELAAWAASDRSAGDEPVEVEQIAVDDGSKRRYFEVPESDDEGVPLPARFAQFLAIQLELAPSPSVALFIHDRRVYLFAVSVLKEGEPPVGRSFTLDIPPPGSPFGPVEDFNPSEDWLPSQPAGSPGPDGPYGAEALQIADHAFSDLVDKLQRWAGSERSSKELPFETIMYDGGEFWRHRELPPTELKRPSLEDRLRELFPLFLDVAPAPSVGCFIHRKKLYILKLACSEPGEAVVNVVRMAVPPPGELFEPPEEVNLTSSSLTGQG